MMEDKICQDMVSTSHQESVGHVHVPSWWNSYLFVFFPLNCFFFIGICTDTSVFEAVETQHFEPLNWKMTDVFFAGMKAEGKWN